MRKNERIFLERILFPTDLSSETTEGLEYAVALARSYGAKLFLCHCLSPRAAEDRDLFTMGRLQPGTWLKPSFFGLFMSITSLVANSGSLREGRSKFRTRAKD